MEPSDWRRENSHVPVVYLFAGERLDAGSVDGMLAHALSGLPLLWLWRNGNMRGFSVTEAIGEIGGNTDNTLLLYGCIEFNAVHIALNANGRTTNSLSAI
jgi:hypothetical protein